MGTFRRETVAAVVHVAMNGDGEVHAEHIVVDHVCSDNTHIKN